MIVREVEVKIDYRAVTSLQESDYEVPVVFKDNQPMEMKRQLAIKYLRHQSKRGWCLDIGGRFTGEKGAIPRH